MRKEWGVRFKQEARSDEEEGATRRKELPGGRCDKMEE